MKKILKRTGGSLCILFNTEDRKVFGLKEGDILDVTINPTNFNWNEMEQRVNYEIKKEVERTNAKQ